MRGFIRAYCSFLRENPEPALGRYQELAGTRAAEQAASAPPRPRNTWASSSVVVGLVLLLILGVGLILVNLSVKKNGGTSVAAPNGSDHARRPPGASEPGPNSGAPGPGAGRTGHRPHPRPPTPVPRRLQCRPSPWSRRADGSTRRTPPPTAPTTTRPASGRPAPRQGSV